MRKNKDTVHDPDGRGRPVLRFIFSVEEAGREAFSTLPDGTTVIPVGTTVGTFLRNHLHFSKRQISSLKFREDGIRVNGTMQRVTRVLCAGDVLEIVPKTGGSLYLDHGTFSEDPDILYEDSELLIVNKPSGMVCHPSPGHYADTLANQAAAYAFRKNENWTIRLVGRLDKDTSGIVIFAKNSETAARLSAPDAVKKEYRALAEGELPASGSICAPIGPDEEVLGKMKIDPDGKPAETFYERIALVGREELLSDRLMYQEDRGTEIDPAEDISAAGEVRPGEVYSLLKLRLIHGRTHQIRLHLASIGHPLAGDAMYGNGRKGRTHAFLFCRSVFLVHPFTGARLQITAPMPSDWPDRA